MKNFTFGSYKKNLLPLFILLGILNSVHATTFTASTSGKWSSSGTWGSSHPSFNLTTDQVIIPQGITVNLDSSLIINGVIASLQVNGTLSSTSSDSLELGYGALTGNGNITLQSVRLDSTSLVTFDGNLTVNTLYSSSAGIQAAATIVVNQTWVVSGGLFSIVSGGNVSLGNNATIIISGGALANTGGTLSLANSYNVMYLQSSTTTGLELSGSGLNNITINVPDSNTITMSSALTVNGSLSLDSGILALNGHTLHIVGNISSGGAGYMYSTNNSSINISTSSSPSGPLQFAAGGNTIKNLTINVTGFNASVNLGSSLTVDGVLTFTSGSLNLQNNGLIISSSGSITGAGTSSYIITGDSGYLAKNLTAGASGYSTFDIGTSSHYTPAQVQLAAGSASGMVQVGVSASVDAQGYTGNDLSATQPVVDATWFVSSNISSNLSLNLGVSWSTAMEVNGFDHDTAYIAHFTNGNWDISNFTSATADGGGMYSIQRTGITSLSPFAVFGKNVATGIKEISDAEFQVYPNPFSENVTINSPDLGEINVDIINLTGQVVNHIILASGTREIPTAQLAQGNYFIHAYSDNMNIVKKIVKM